MLLECGKNWSNPCNNNNKTKELFPQTTNGGKDKLYH